MQVFDMLALIVFLLRSVFMTVEQKQILISDYLKLNGWFHLVIFSILAILLILLAIINPHADFIDTTILILQYWIFFLILLAPQIIGANKLKQKTSNSYEWGFIASILALTFFPIGTFVGIRALFFLLSTETREFYKGNTN